MTRTLNVHLLPAMFEPEALRDGIAVVIDVLRASTTMTLALQNGAAGIIPCGSIEEANSAFERSPDTVLRGGERGGVKIDGFELSNSPDDYSPNVVDGRTIAFTTTNGTRALLRCGIAERILVGSFVNLSGVVNELAGCCNPIHLVCAGTNGAVTNEDVLFAGCIVQRLTGCVDIPDVDESRWELSDSSLLALCAWLQMTREMTLPEALLRSKGARNLMALGYDRDIQTAGMIDLCSIVGIFDGNTKRITASPAAARESG
ncbi:MAG: 2-phosphosulfolactate phosphatase [Planctomycetaceae bacterium]